MDKQALEETFAAAKRVDLDDFLTAVLGVKPQRVNGWLRYCSCPACGEGPKDSLRLSTRNGYWRCFRCEKDGDVIKAAAAFYGTDRNMLEAAKRLLGEFSPGEAEAIRQSRTQMDEEDARRHKAFEHILSTLRGIDFGSGLPAPVMRYLTVNRALPADLVKAATAKGMILGLPTDSHAIAQMLRKHFSTEELELSKVWKRDSKWPPIAFRPLVFPLPGGTAAEFRTIDETKLREGSPKAIRYGKTTRPWVWEGTDPTRPALIVEGFIDMLSTVALGHAGDVIAVPGTNSWSQHAAEWFGHLKGRRVVVCFDNDKPKSGPIQNPGQHWAGQLVTALRGLGVKEVENKVLPMGLDANDILKARAAKSAKVA